MNPKDYKRKETFRATVGKGYRFGIPILVREVLGVEEYDLARLVFKLEERGIVPTKATETKGYQIEESYLTIVDSGCRVNVPLPVRVFLGVEQGDRALIIFNLEKRRISRIKDVSVVPKPEVAEPEPEPEPDVEVHIVPEIAEADVYPEPEPEVELPQKQIHENPCPQGLSYPLQDLNLCQSRMCSYFKRQQGEYPAECIWPGWKEIGQEEEPDADSSWKKMKQRVYTIHLNKHGYPPKCSGTLFVDEETVECGKVIEVGDWHYRQKNSGRIICPKCAEHVFNVDVPSYVGITEKTVSIIEEAPEIIEDKLEPEEPETWYEEERDSQLKKYLEDLLQDELEIDAEMGFYRPKNVILRITPIDDQEELFTVEVLPHGEHTRIDLYVRATDEDLAEDREDQLQ